ncbi:MAG: hypothetical protein KAJ28_06035 [Flavobacteriaceae bacterium]|nr:hypothetical protein [Flavobacteriaceae bacterium]
MRVIFLLLIVLTLSCNNDKKQSGRITTDVSFKNEIDTIAIYNTILNDLIENHLYNKYLGNDGEKLFIDLLKNRIDSTDYNNKYYALKNKIVAYDSLKGTLYINDESFKNDNIDINRLSLPENLSLDFERITKNINQSHTLNIIDFDSKFVKIKPSTLKSTDNTSLFNVGDLAFSKLYINKNQSYGVLYFAFICGSTCGQADVLLIKKEDNIWKIEKFYPIWEI